eukprot:scaffold153528_cov43-Prasinocladus_malaysianus.AAC.2
MIFLQPAGARLLSKCGFLQATVVEAQKGQNPKKEGETGRDPAAGADSPETGRGGQLHAALPIGVLGPRRSL